MPVCHLCKTFYVRPQTFATLFIREGLCVLCETYGSQPLNCSVLPYGPESVELYSFGHPEHPAFLKTAFNHFAHHAEDFVFLEDTWFEEPIVFLLMVRLFTVFRLFSYERQDYLLERIFGSAS
ncbi:MAG: hypothetical protein EA374_05235 [Acholeplasmatales bacterium]|nr:MAG: hypothetical protein EA374_05235 [Acholeplasmatales bacterium]